MVASEEVGCIPCRQLLSIALVDDERIVDAFIIQSVDDSVPVVLYFIYIIGFSDKLGKCAALGSIVLVEHAYIQLCRLEFIILCRGICNEDRDDHEYYDIYHSRRQSFSHYLHHSFKYLHIFSSLKRQCRGL